jgi:hypothetical protein
MSGTYSNILNLQDMHSYYDGNIQISGTLLWVIDKHHQWSKRSIYLNAKLLKILET